MDDDALVLIYKRNQFYREKCHVMFGIAALCLLIIGLLIGTIVYLVKDPPHPLYFVTDDAGRLIRDIPATDPNMSNQDVGAWVKEAVERAYSYDFINYRGQLQLAQKYFTTYGWDSYMKGLQSSDNLLALSQRKWIVIAKVVGDPKLIGATHLGAARVFAWKFEMPILVSYYSPPYDERSKVDNPITITVVVERESILSSYKGLGIVQMIGTLAQ